MWVNKQTSNKYLTGLWLRDPKFVNGVNIYTPKPVKNITQTKMNRYKRRAAIEPVIGHLKSDYRLNRNFLKGIAGDEINVLLAAAAMNFTRVINLWKQRLTGLHFYLKKFISFILPSKLKNGF